METNTTHKFMGSYTHKTNKTERHPTTIGDNYYDEKKEKTEKAGRSGNV